MVLSQLSYSPTCAQESILADFPPRCQSARQESAPHSRSKCAPWGTPAARSSSGAERGDSFKSDKVFLRSADQRIEQVPGFRRNTLLTRWQRKKYSPWRKQIGGNEVEMRSILRMESPPRSLRDPSRACARESTPGKGSRRARLPRTAISSSRKERFSGIANRPHVIRERRVNIKKVHGNRHFPVDTVNAIF